MRRLAPPWLLLTLLVLPPALAAQREEKAAEAPEALRREITRLEERIGHANFTCDYKLFAHVEAAEFIFTDGSGGLTTRSQDLAAAELMRGYWEGPGDVG